MTDLADRNASRLSRRSFVGRSLIAGTMAAGAAAAVPGSASAATGSTQMEVTNEILWSTDPRVGLSTSPGKYADQTAALQRMANLLTQSTNQGDRVGYIVPGTYAKSKPIIFRNTNSNLNFRLFGRGSKSGGGAPTVIVDNVDCGAGTYSLTLTGPSAFALDGICLQGGNHPSSLGTTVWQMRAINLSTYCTVRDFTAGGYFSGITITGDHILVEDFVTQSNAYGIEFGPSAVTQGDIQFRRGRSGGCYIGAIGVARSGQMAGVRFEDVEASMSPFVIKRYDDGTGKTVPNWINGVDVINMSTEYTGNGIVYNDLDGSGINNVSFDHGSTGNYSLYSGFIAKNYRQIAAWYNVGSISGVNFPKSLPTFTSSQPAVYAPAIVNVVSPDASTLPGSFVAAKYPFKLFENVNGQNLAGTACGDNRGYRTLVVPYKTDAAVGLGMCLVASNLYEVTGYNGSGRVVGIAGHDASAKSVVHAIQNGIQIWVQNTSGTAIPQNALLVPDPKGGVAAGSYSSGQVIGRAYNAIPARSLGYAELHI